MEVVRARPSFCPRSEGLEALADNADARRLRPGLIKGSSLCADNSRFRTGLVALEIDTELRRACADCGIIIAATVQEVTLISYGGDLNKKNLAKDCSAYLVYETQSPDRSRLLQLSIQTMHSEAIFQCW